MQTPLLLLLTLLLSSCVTINVSKDGSATSSRQPDPNDPIDFSDLDNSPNNSDVPSTSDLTIVSELVIEDTQLGTGTEATVGDTISVHYTGTLTNGVQFDSSVDSDEPFTFTLGTGQVIAGWDRGLVGMKVGGHRKLTIPADLAYGEIGAPPTIPPGATLIFTVELLSVE